MIARLLAGALLLATVAQVADRAVVLAQDAEPLATFDAAWTLVRDSHFDRTLNGVDWNAVRSELRPKAAAAKSAGELRAVLRDMLGRLGQSHFAVIPSSGDSPSKAAPDMAGDTGLDVRLVDGEILVSSVEPDSSAAQSGVKPGWKVVSIGGTSLGPLVSELPAESRLRSVEAWRIAQERLRGTSGTRVRVALEDMSSRLHDLTLERRPETGEPVTIGHLPTMFVRVESERRQIPGGLSAGVIRFNVWMTAVDREFDKAISAHRDADGIIIDLRGNPGGLAAMLMGISGHFVSERKTLGTMKTRESELRFVANPRFVNAAGERVTPFAGPLAIIVDSMSGSASECFTGGMQGMKRARVFGQTSMGQALPALFNKLPNGDILIHAYGDFVAADGTRLEGRGVVPDEITPLTREALARGQDPAMDAALAWVARSAGRK